MTFESEDGLIKIRQFPELEKVDLRENPIENIIETVSILKEAMPKLNDLQLNLYEEEHVDYIMKTLPELQFLNGLPVEREEESDEE